MKAILGRKVGMSQIFSPTGEAVPVTIISCEPNIITLNFNKNSSQEYVPVQLALPRKKIETSEKRPTKPNDQKTAYAARKEFSVSFSENQKVVTIDQFAIGDIVQVSGTSKGKGFQGVVKRHGFKGGPASHGHRHVLRSGGSIGSAYPQHVMKGKKMAGRMGSDRVTVKNLRIVWIDISNNALAVHGAVPGASGSIVEIKEI